MDSVASDLKSRVRDWQTSIVGYDKQIRAAIESATQYNFGSDKDNGVLIPESANVFTIKIDDNMRLLVLKGSVRYHVVSFHRGHSYRYDTEKKELIRLCKSQKSKASSQIDSLYDNAMADRIIIAPPLPSVPISASPATISPVPVPLLSTTATTTSTISNRNLPDNYEDDLGL